VVFYSFFNTPVVNDALRRCTRILPMVDNGMNKLRNKHFLTEIYDNEILNKGKILRISERKPYERLVGL
jgi:hypothetical protein